MHRFFVSPDRCSTPEFDLGDAEARHAHQVLRLGRGDRLEVLDGRGTLIEAEILSAGRGGVVVRALSRRVRDRPACRLVLLQALLKGKAMEVVLEKSVELGVDSLVLLDTGRCVARVPAGEAGRKRDLWTQTLVEAAKQSRNPWLPELVGPLPLGQALDTLSLPPGGATLLFGSLEPDAPPMGQVLEEMRRNSNTPTGTSSMDGAGAAASRRWALAIGPEGDFTPDELDRLHRQPGHAVSLGPLILRAETAAIAAMALLADAARRLDAGTDRPAPAFPKDTPTTPTA